MAKALPIDDGDARRGKKPGPRLLQIQDVLLAPVEKALQEGEAQYQMLLDSISDYAIFMLDPQGLVMSWNAGAERIKGYAAEEIIGRHFSCFFPPEEVESGRPDEILHITATTGRHEERCMRVRKDGSQFLGSVTFTSLRDSAGELRGFQK